MVEAHPDNHSSSPLRDMPEEGRRIVDHAREKSVQLRLIGGLAVRVHCRSSAFCERPYSDIDLIGLSSQAVRIEQVFRELGYIPDNEFNALHGGQRLKYQDRANNRHAEIFLDKFRMDQTLDFSGRLDIDPYTISLADLFITKIQVVKMDEKDFHDLFSLLRDHKIGVDDREGVVNARYVAQLCAHDWGLYHTLLKNLERLPEFYEHYHLDKEERESMDRKIWVIRLMVLEEHKGPIWRARDRLGERLPYHEELERDE